jgi:DNA replication protein DnaC
MVKKPMNIKDFTTEELRFQAIWSSCGIPPRLINASFANYEPVCSEKKRALIKCQAFADKGLDIVRQGRGLYLQGLVGTGKSHLAVSVLRSILQNNINCFGSPPGKFSFIDEPVYEGLYCSMYSVVDMLETLRDSYNNDQLKASARTIMHRARSDALIILDDIGAEKPSEYAAEQLYALIDFRYRTQRSTIFTTNCTLKQLEIRIGQRSVSRIMEMCDGVRVGGEDWRKRGLH